MQFRFREILRRPPKSIVPAGHDLRARARGAVGDISGHYFDIHGNRILGDVEDRILSLPWDDFKSLKNVIAVACGLDKKNAIRGALRTGLINRLIVDDQTALAVLQETENAILKLPHSNEAKD